jgi:hypothetical protein
MGERGVLSFQTNAHAFFTHTAAYSVGERSKDSKKAPARPQADERKTSMQHQA